MKSITFIISIVLAVSINIHINAFTAQPRLTTTRIRFSSLSMAKFDKSEQRWLPTKAEEEPSAGYGLVGSLVRAGPIPFFQRVVNPDKYEQAVLKYMAKEKCDRIQAQGNMDAFFENPSDWQYQKLQEKNGAPKYDYGNRNTSTKDLILTGTWSVIVVVFFVTFTIDCLSGKYAKG